MRFFKLTLGEIRFQLRYGFYFLYAIFTIVYLCLLWAVPTDIRKILATILIFSDPAAMGLFFMGAIVLLEKSERVNCSLAVSPIKIWEYISAKVVSLAIIGTIVGGVLAAFAGVNSLILTIIGVSLSSVLFSLCGLLVAMKIDTLNKFMIATVPFEIVICVPPVLMLFGTEYPWLSFHPGVAAIKLIYGGNSSALLHILVLFLWSVLAFLLCKRAVIKSFSQMGGGKI